MAAPCPCFNAVCPFARAAASQRYVGHSQSFKETNMGLILLILVLVLLFGGGGGYYAHRSYGGYGSGGVLGLIVIVLLVVWLFGGFGSGYGYH